jgi:hypothetical protein
MDVSTHNTRTHTANNDDNEATDATRCIIDPSLTNSLLPGLLPVATEFLDLNDPNDRNPLFDPFPTNFVASGLDMTFTW